MEIKCTPEELRQIVNGTEPVLETTTNADGITAKIRPVEDIVKKLNIEGKIDILSTINKLSKEDNENLETKY